MRLRLLALAALVFIVNFIFASRYAGQENSARAMTARHRARTRASRPLARSTEALAARTRGPVSAWIHRRSPGAMKCHVGRIACVRRMAPLSNARATASSSSPCARWPMAQRAISTSEAVAIARRHRDQSGAGTEPGHQRTGWDAAALFGGTPDRLLPRRLLQHERSRRRLAHGLRRSHEGFSRVFAFPRQRSVDGAPRVQFSGLEARRSLVPVRHALEGSA
mgnify:CR=1 FL=1